MTRWAARRGWASILAPSLGRRRGEFLRATSDRPWIEIGPTKRNPGSSDYHAIVVHGEKIIYDGGQTIIRTDRFLFMFRTRRLSSRRQAGKP